MTGVPQALAGLKVACFGGYAAGPHIGKVLANFGASVVHVESRDRPDGFRLQYPPFAGNRHGVNRGGCFSYFNDSKYGVTIDLKKPEGVELARRLAGWCDIVIENMRPGVMERLGLGFEALREINPRLVMLSTCNMGQTGPRADHAGIRLAALRARRLLRHDRLPGRSADAALRALYRLHRLLARRRRRCSPRVIRARRSGKGAYIDVSQYECGADVHGAARCRTISPPAISPSAAATTIARPCRTARFPAATANG